MESITAQDSASRANGGENMKISVGVDLHKGQFTVYWRPGNGTEGRFETYATSSKAYEKFEEKLRDLQAAGNEVKVAVESTGNTRYLRRT